MVGLRSFTSNVEKRGGVMVMLTKIEPTVHREIAHAPVGFDRQI
jgi:hypothetical protein